MNRIMPKIPVLSRGFSSAIFAILISGLVACESKVDSEEEASEAIIKLVAETVQPTYVENTYRANIQLSSTNLLSMLPDLSEYPMTLDVRDTSQIEAVEIFTSSEKAGKGRDGFYNQMATAFNSQRRTISNGKLAAVGIRKIASGLGTPVYFGQALYS